MATPMTEDAKRSRCSVSCLIIGRQPATEDAKRSRCNVSCLIIGRQPATKKAEGLRGGMIATGMVFDLEKFVDWCYDGIK